MMPSQVSSSHCRNSASHYGLDVTARFDGNKNSLPQIFAPLFIPPYP